MADEKYTFEQARIRLEEIAVEVRKKDTSLEKSLDLLEEGVRLANICTELVDHTDIGAAVVASFDEIATESELAGSSSEDTAAIPDGSPEAVDDTETDACAVAEASATETETGDEADGDSEGFDDVDDDITEPSDADTDG